jgi:hypothetical protein
LRVLRPDLRQPVLDQCVVEGRVFFVDLVVPAAASDGLEAPAFAFGFAGFF